MDTQSSHNCVGEKSSLVSDSITGEILCSACGMVLNERTYDLSEDVQTFSKEEYLTKKKVLKK